MSHPLNQQLADAVRSLGTVLSNNKADQFELKEEEFSGHLDLSHMDFWSSDVERIGKTLNPRFNAEAVELISVKFNFNTLMGCDGTISLLNHLPGRSIRALHLVGCGIGDHGGRAIIEWLNQASYRIKEVNLEQNDFSREVKDEFELYGRENPQVMVIF